MLYFVGCSLGFALIVLVPPTHGHTQAGAAQFRQDAEALGAASGGGVPNTFWTW